jgi:hypothetical protein
MIYTQVRKTGTDESVTAAPTWLATPLAARHIVPLSVGAFFAALVIALVFKLTRPDPLPIGSPLPMVLTHGMLSDSILRLTPGRTNVIVYFHAGCAACEAEMTSLNRENQQLGQVNLILLSGDPPDSVRAFSRRWANLVASDRIRWLAGNGSTIEGALGIRATPTIFVFNPHGRLQKKITGEASAETILSGTSNPK